MRKHMIVVAAVGIIGLFTDAVSAKVVQISGTHSRDEINTKCAAAGGITGGRTGGGYGCFNGNKGTSVDCDAKGHCVGWVPRQASSGGGLGGILGGGDSATGASSTRRGADRAGRGDGSQRPATTGVSQLQSSDPLCAITAAPAVRLRAA